jgi:hypothetical protein
VLIDHASFHDAFCADVPMERARVMALTQRPVAVDAFTTVVTGAPAWHSLPSWAIVATADHAIHPDAERDMAKRAAAEVVELDASHAVAVAQPDKVAKVILRAVQGTRHDNDDLFGQRRREQPPARLPAAVAGQPRGRRDDRRVGPDRDR